jgi:hypothetical protein
MELRGNAMAPKTLWVIFLIAFAALVGTDYLAWKASNLSLHLGQVGGLASPVDDYFNSHYDNMFKKERLEKQLATATNEEEYLAVTKDLAKVLGDLGYTVAQSSLLVEIVEKYPNSRDTRVIEANKVLAESYASAGRVADTLQKLECLREIALKPNLNNTLINDVLRIAEKAKAEDFYVQTSELLLKSNIKPDQQLSIMVNLMKFYEKNGKKDKVASTEKSIQELRKKVDVSKILEKEAKSIIASFAAGNFDAGFASTASLIKQFPDQREQLQLIYVAAVIQAARAKNAVALTKGWGFLAKTEYVPSSTKDKATFDAFSKAAMDSARYFLEINDLEGLARIGEMTSNLSDEFAYLIGNFVKGEIWARTGRKGSCPKLLYKIVYRPGQDLELDGNFDESVYKDLQPFPGDFWRSFCGGGVNLPIVKEEQFTLTAYAFYTEKYLYLCVNAFETNMSLIRLAQRSGDNREAWKDDCIEFFLDPHRDLKYLHQWIGSAGSSYAHYQHTGGDESLTRPEGEGLKSAARRFSDHYQVEIRIPLTQLVDSGDVSGMLVNADIRRQRHLSTSMKAGTEFENAAILIVCWSPTGGGFHPARYNFMEFEKH